VHGEVSSDVLKIWLYSVASVLLGAWCSPLLYNAGKALAEISSVKETNGPLEHLANLCDRSEFPAFFTTGLVVAALLLFFPFMAWLRGGRAAQADSRVGGERSWNLRLPDGARGQSAGQRLRGNPDGVSHLILGFILAVTLFFFIGGALMLSGVFRWKTPSEPWLFIFLRAGVIAFGLAVLQEVLFRGIALGVFLRAMPSAAALGMSALLFALVHFLQPPVGLDVFDPDASGTGFELLRKILALFGQPRALLSTFAPMLALGGVLAYARWRTASLCLPIGLHAGWLFVNSVLGTIAVSSSHPQSSMWIFSGESLRQGLVPLLGILAAGYLANQWISRGNASEPA